MASRTYRPRNPHDATPLRRRAAGFALAVAVNLLLLLVLRGLGVIPPLPQEPSSSLVVDLFPQTADPEVRPDKAAAKPREATRRVPPRPRPPQLPSLKSPIPPLRPLAMIELSPEEFAAADVAALPEAGAGSGSAGDSEEVGRAPNGEMLYAAEWARRPTDAELSGYLPANPPEGSGLVACKTVPGNRVDNCIELGDMPRGTRLARAVRLAAWQFRVRPPRKNGRAMVGEWVRIRIDYFRARSD